MRDICLEPLSQTSSFSAWIKSPKLLTWGLLEANTIVTLIALKEATRPAVLLILHLQAIMSCGMWVVALPPGVETTTKRVAPVTSNISSTLHTIEITRIIAR